MLMVEIMIMMMDMDIPTIIKNLIFKNLKKKKIGPKFQTDKEWRIQRK